MNGAEPPSSSTTLLPTFAASSATARPARTLPVTVAALTRGSAMTAGHASTGIARLTYSPSGPPASRTRASNASAEPCTVSACLMMAVLPTKGSGIEEAQHLPEGQVPWHNGEDRPHRFIDDLRR